MNEYKYASKVLGKEKKEFKLFDGIKKIVFKILISILLLLMGLIILKIDKKSSGTIYKFIYETNFDFATLNELYKKYFGDIIPFESEVSSFMKQDIPVFSEEISYKNLSIYKEGVSLEVGTDYLVPVLDEGIVIFIGEKEGFGNTVIIQQTDGVNVWYGNISNINANLYDYVSKGEFLGTAVSNDIYFVLEKDGEYLDYKEYFK